MATDNEIVVKLTADQEALQAGMDAAAASVQSATDAMQASMEDASAAIDASAQAASDSVTAATEQMTAAVQESAGAVAEATAAQQSAIAEEAAAFNASVQAKIAAMTRLNAAFAGGVGSTASVAEAEAALDEAMATGAITAAEYAGYISTLDNAEASLTTSVTASTVAVDANTEAMVINGGVARELGVLVGELARGNYTRLEGSTITLANRTGLLQKAFSGMGPPIIAAAAAVAAFGIAAVEGAEEQAKFEGAILMTGQSAGVTAADLEDMSERIGQASGSFGKSKDALLAIVRSGKIAADQIELVGLAAQDMARLTGESVDKSVQAFVKLQEKPVQAVVALNDQYHFLTESVFDQIQALQQEGNTQEAARVATEAYSQAVEQRAQEVQSHLGLLARAWDSVKSSASFAWDAMLNVGKSSTLNDQIGDAQDALEKFHSMGLAQFSVKAGHVGWEATDEGKSDSAVAFEIANLKKLQAERDQMNQKAKAAAANDAQVKEYTDDASALDKWNAKLKDNENLQAQIAEHKAQVEKVHKESPNSPALKGYTFDASGAVTGGEQWTATVAKLTKEYGENLTGAIRKANTEAAQAHREMTEQVKRELREAAQAQENAARQQRELNLQNIKSAHDETIGELANKRDGYEQQYADGQISAKQLLQLESDLMTQKLAADRAYYEAKAKLDAADPVAVAKDDAAIIKAQQDAVATMLKNEKEFHNNSEKQWDSYAKKVEGAMQGAINGMLFQHQKLRQGIASVAMVIGEDFIQQAVMKPLDAWISAEASKVAASISTSTSLQVQRAANSTADATASAAAVARATGVAGAQGTASFAGAPWPVDMGAPAFGAAMAAVSASYGAVASAAGGWERVPIDGMMTELHKDEQVLPAPYADGLRKVVANANAGGGNAGGGNHFHVNAVDTRTFADAIRRNPRAMAETIKKAHRMGHLGGVR